MPARPSYRFGEFTLDLRRGALLRGPTEVRLRPKSFAVLEVLVARHGELVTKEELLDAVWGRTVVTEGAIGQCLIDIRRALGDEAQERVRTVPRRGYLFAGPVTAVPEAPAPPPEPAPDTPAPAAADTVAVAPTRPTGPVRPMRAVAVAALLAALVVVAVGWSVAGRDGDRSGRRGATKPAAAAAAGTVDPRPSVAVLPFANLTADARGEYFSDGISEEILHLLVQSDGLRVIARTSSFAFKNQPVGIDDIATRLGVGYVVEGSVRSSGPNLRITAQLIDARDSSHVWSRVYDGDARDVLAVQRDIASQIAAALEATLAVDPRSALPAPTPAAYEAFLRARFTFNRRLPGDLVRAQQAFEEALRFDPRFARAAAGLAGVYAARIVEEPDADADALLRKAREAVETALRLDPDSAEARIRAARYHFEIGDVERAEREAAIAQDLAPEDPAVLSWFAASLASQGRFEESIAMERRVVAADPISRVVRINFGHHLLAAGLLEEARTELERAIEIEPHTATEVAVDLVRILLLEGRYQEAWAEAERWPPGPDRDFVIAVAGAASERPVKAAAAVGRLRAGTGPGEALRLAEFHAYRGEHDHAFEWLDTAYDRLGTRAYVSMKWQWIYPLRFSPFLRSLRSDPRWADSTRRADPVRIPQVARRA